MTTKEAIIETIKGMPDNISLRGILSELYLQGKIADGPPGFGGVPGLLQPGLLSDGNTIIPIRLPKNQRGKAWRAMIEIGPVRLVAKDPIYEVTPAHLALLKAAGFSYEVVTRSPKLKGNHRRAPRR